METNNTINGKTPEEIKKGIVDAIEEASWVVEGGDAHDLIESVEKAHASMADSLALIQQLECERDEARNDLDTLNYAVTELHGAYEAMKCERDAAVEQLKEVDRVDLFRCSHCAHDELCNDGLTSCIDCDKDCPCRTCEKSGNWQWRGVQEVE